MWLHTGGSLLLPMLLHAATNTVTFAWGWLAGADQLRLWWIWAALWAAATVVNTPPEVVGRDDSRTNEVARAELVASSTLSAVLSW